jgi:Tol biopolymer transport system component
MTSEHRFEQHLPGLLEDLYLGPAPDYRDELVQRVARTPQRPAWTFPERWLPMSVITLGRLAPRPLPWRTLGLLAVLALLLAVALAIYVGSPRNLPAPFGPARNGVVVFEEQGDIIVVDPDSGRRTVAVGGPSVDSAPAFSRDGTRLAFLRESGTAKSLWMAKADGTDQRQLSADPLDAFNLDAGPNPASWMEWAPDGGSILLNTMAGGIRAITIVPTDGGDPFTLDVGMLAWGPTWRPPDGREILFRGEAGTGFGLFAVRPDGTGLRNITPANGVEWDGLFYSWSPDGTRLVYQWLDNAAPRRQRLYIVAADGGDPRPITNAESVGGLWSPDGTKVAFFDTDSSVPGDVAPLSIVQVDAPNERTALSTDGGGSAAWAPDSMTIIWLPESSDTPVLLDTRGGPPQPVSWSVDNLPDWQRLAP